MKVLFRSAVALQVAAVFSVVSVVGGCASVGGQSGDDGDFKPPDPTTPQPEPQPPDPGGPWVPPIDDCNDDAHRLSADEVSHFGRTPEQLLAGLQPNAVPFFWVAYDSAQVELQYSPGPGETTLNLELEVRSEPVTDESNVDIVDYARVAPEGTQAQCANGSVDIPVWATLRTDDGALDERVATRVTFTSIATASFYARIPFATHAGSLAYAALTAKADGVAWQPSDLFADVQVWPGGSGGRLQPEFTLTQPSAPAMPPAVPATATGPAPAEMPNAIRVPEAWDVLGTWPVNGVCASGGSPRRLTDAVVGVSVAGLVGELNALSPWTLAQPTDPVSDPVAVDFETVAPSGPLCVETNSANNTVRFTLASTLQAAPAALGSLSTLQADLSTDVSVSVNPLAPTEVAELQFERRLDQVAVAVSRADLTQNTGLSLDVADQFQRFWWTWYGSMSTSLDGSPTRHAELRVASPTAEQTAQAEAEVTAGGPGFGVGGDGQLPGQLLLHAVSQP